MNADKELADILRQIDDHEPAVVLKGLKALQQCLDRVDQTPLYRKIWAHVVFDALEKIIHSKDAEVVAQLGVALLRTLPIVEKRDPNTFCDKLTKYDDVLKKILFTMDFSSSAAEKKEWLIHLEKFIEEMGHASMHWVDRINSMLLGFASSGNCKEWVLILKVVQALIKNTWMKPSLRDWVQIIVKILFNQGVASALSAETERPDKAEMTEIYSNVKFCFELMSKCQDFPSIQSDLRLFVKTIEKQGKDNLYQTKLLEELDKCEIRTKFL